MKGRMRGRSDSTLQAIRPTFKAPEGVYTLVSDGEYRYLTRNQCSSSSAAASSSPKSNLEIGGESSSSSIKSASASAASFLPGSRRPPPQESATILFFPHPSCSSDSAPASASSSSSKTLPLLFPQRSFSPPSFSPFSSPPSFSPLSSPPPFSPPSFSPLSSPQKMTSPSASLRPSEEETDRQEVAAAATASSSSTPFLFSFNTYDAILFYPYDLSASSRQQPQQTASSSSSSRAPATPIKPMRSVFSASSVVSYDVRVGRNRLELLACTKPTSSASSSSSSSSNNIIYLKSLPFVSTTTTPTTNSTTTKKKSAAHLFNQKNMIEETVKLVKWLPHSSHHFVAVAGGDLFLLDKKREEADNASLLQWHPPLSSSPTSSQSVKQEEGEFFIRHQLSRYNPISVWHVSTKPIYDLAFSHSGRYIALVGADGYLRVFDFHKQALLVAFQSFFGGLRCVAWSPDDRFILTGGEDDLVSIFDPFPTAPSPSHPSSLTSTPTKTDSQQKRRTRTRTYSVVARWQQRHEGPCLLARGEGHKSWINAVAFDPLHCHPHEGKYRFASVGRDTQLLFWEFNFADYVEPTTRRTYAQRTGMVVPPLTYEEALVLDPIAHHQVCVTSAASVELPTSLCFVNDALLTASVHGGTKIWQRPGFAPTTESEKIESDALPSSSSSSQEEEQTEKPAITEQ
ncbi:ERMES complex Ca(2+)-binding regulatory GTPase gem1 [Balamuthia mandrillaris]